VAFRRKLFRIRYRYVSSLSASSSYQELTLVNPPIGGNHFRAYKQNGTEANSGAWFLAVSKEVVRLVSPRSSLPYRVAERVLSIAGSTRETQDCTERL